MWTSRTSAPTVPRMSSTVYAKAPSSPFLRANPQKAHESTQTFVAPTNVCVLSCAFCGFARRKGEDGAFEYTVEDIVGMVGAEVREVHIVGGHHPDWPFEHYERVMAPLHAPRPQVPTKAFTAPELASFCPPS